MTNELIPVTIRSIGGTEPVQTVNARELHGFLGVGKKFADWIKARLETLGFQRGVDWIEVFPETGNNPLGGRPTIDYVVSLDMAKHLCMIERNEQGKQLRAYFIEREKLSWQPAPQLDLNDPATLRQMLLGYTETVMQLQAAVTEMTPKAALVDAHVSSRMNDTLTRFVRTLDGVNSTKIKADLLRLGYLWKPQGSAYRVRHQYRGILFVEKLNEHSEGEYDIFVLVKGKEEIVKLYNQGKLTMLKRVRRSLPTAA
jgi:anti-repressor protein